MHLIAITSTLHQPKALLVEALVQALPASRLFLIDNADKPIKIENIMVKRLSGGCVCCSLAGALIPLIARLNADYVLMPVSSRADAESLSLLLDNLRDEHLRITKIALIDEVTRMRHPYLAQNLARHSDIVLYEPFIYDRVVQMAISSMPSRRHDDTDECAD